MASEGRPLDELVEAVAALEKWLSAESVSHAYIGGLAVAFLGRARVTRDVDSIVALQPEAIAQFINSGEEFGFLPRYPGEADFAEANLVIRMAHAVSGVAVDLSVALTSLEQEAISLARAIRSGEVEFPVVAPEHLVVMKAFARRPRDLADVESILDRHPDIDLGRVRFWLRELAEAVADPTILSDFEELFQRWRGDKPSSPDA